VLVVLPTSSGGLLFATATCALPTPSRYLIEKGRKDARAWATSVGLVTDQASETSNLAHVGAAHVKGQGAAENRIGEALEAK
jgi:hypothetical protein